MDSRPTLNLYVDGFNLYRRCLDDRPQLKWLDLVRLAKLAFPFHDVNRVRYFTAHLKLRGNQDAQRRQQVYLRAIEADPLVEVKLGRFRVDPRWMPALPESFREDGSRHTVKVEKTEEKGSDVNLASYLIADSYERDASLYVVVSNDSDLVAPLNIVKQRVGAHTALLSPSPTGKGVSKDLKQTNPDHVQLITHDMLAAAQLPPTVRRGNKVLTRPDVWS